jgi:hypothetical protein
MPGGGRLYERHSVLSARIAVGCSRSTWSALPGTAPASEAAEDRNRAGWQVANIINYKQYRPDRVGEDRNQTVPRTVPAVGGGSTDPRRSVRIATSSRHEDTRDTA